mgnify:CR=1 FL=1
MKSPKFTEPAVYKCQSCGEEKTISSKKKSIKCYCSGLMFKLTPMEMILRGEDG